MPPGPRLLTALNRPMGRVTTVALGLLLCAAPAWLFYAPASAYARNPIAVSRLQHDDFLYVALSRNAHRTVENLFVPHATHIVPAFRLLTLGLVKVAGRLSRLPALLAWVSYAILVAVMVLTGRLVARETGRPAAGFAAMCAVGCTSVMTAVATWYSAGQTLWAGFGVLATLWYLQGWRRSGGALRLGLAALSAALAGWFWTIGHLAGPVGALYLWVDGRPRCRKAAVVPLAATAVAVAVGMALGAHRIESRISFHGRTTREAADPVQGALHTGQAITENLLLGNLGLSSETTQVQGAIVAAAVFLAWFATTRRVPRLNPLEAGGAAFLLGSYLIEWTVRGYLPFASLRGILPWYDANPQIGAVLFVAGWWERVHPNRLPAASGEPRMTRLAGLKIVLLAAGLIVVNRSRVETQWWDMVPLLAPWEVEHYPRASQKSVRTTLVAESRAGWQRRHLVKLEQAEATATRMGIGRDGLERAFGKLDAPGLPPTYDAMDLLDVPVRGRETDPVRIREILGPYVTMEPDPRPPKLPETEPWPIHPR